MRLSRFASEFGLSRADAENWVYRKIARAPYAETIPGRAREFSRHQVLELAVIGALVATGCKPATAGAHAEGLVEDYRMGRLPQWGIFPAGAYESGHSSAAPSSSDIEEEAAKSPFRAAIAVNLLDIANRVEALFAEEAD